MSYDRTRGCNPLHQHPNLVLRMVVANVLFLHGRTRKSSPRNVPEGLFLHLTLPQREKKELLSRKNQKLRAKTLFLNPRYGKEAVLLGNWSPYPEDPEGPPEKRRFLSNQETSTERVDIPWTSKRASGRLGIGRR